MLNKTDFHLFYYVWWGTLEHDGAYRHWNNNGYHPEVDDIDCDYFPKLGVYSSKDPIVIAQHMEDIQRSGVGTIIISWWGQGSYEDECVAAVLDAAAIKGIKVGFLIENYSGRTVNSVLSDVEYLYTTYGSHSAFYRVTKPNKWGTSTNPRGVFYLYNYLEFSDASWASALDTLRGTANDGIFLGQTTDVSKIDSGHLDGLFPYDAYANDGSLWAGIGTDLSTLDALWSAGVGPGFNDVRDLEGLVKSRQNGKTMTNMFGLAIHSQPTFVSITSFNEIHEGSQIEPCVPKTIAGHNLILNPGFETDLSNWGYDAGVFSRSNDTAKDGSYSIKFSSASVQNIDCATDFINVAAGEEYTASAWLYRVTGYTGAITIDIMEYDSGGSVLVDGVNSAAPSVADTWEQVSISQTMNASTVKVKIRMICDGDTTGVAYGDSFVLVKTPSVYVYNDFEDAYSKTGEAAEYAYIDELSELVLQESRRLSIARPLSVNRPVVMDDKASLRFNAGGNKITLASLIEIVDNFSIEVVFKTRNIYGLRQCLFYTGNPSSNGYGFFLNRDTSSNYGLYFLRGGVGWSRLTTVPKGEWNNIIFIRNNGVLTVLVNGVQVYQGTPGNPGAPTGATVIGSESAGGAVGFLKRFRFWPKILSPAECLSVSIGESVPSGMEVEYLLNEGAGTTAFDTSGNGNNGIITGAAWSTDTPSEARTLSDVRPLST